MGVWASYTVGKIPLSTTLSDQLADILFTSKEVMKRSVSLWGMNVGCWGYSRRMLIKET